MMKEVQRKRRGQGLLRAVALGAAVTLTARPAFPTAGAEAAGEVSIPDVAEPGIGDPISDAEMEDLQTIATQSGMSLKAAIERYAWNDNFALAVSMIRDTFPNDFAGAAIMDATHAWVAFAGPVPEAAEGIIEVFVEDHGRIAVELRTDSGFTEVGLGKAIEEIHYAVLATPGVSDATTSYSYETRNIATTVVLKSSAPDSLLDDLLGVAEESLVKAAEADLLEAITTSVVRSNSTQLVHRTSNAEHLGGETVNGSLLCTSGFGTKNPSSIRGISTAGHCPDALTDDGVGLTLIGQHEGTHGDFQWHTGGATETDDFYAGNSTTLEVNRRDVSAVGAPVVGQSLCKNGRTTKKSCEDVRLLGYCGGGLCNLIQMETRSVEDGDSGGPVFYGNTAYGLVMGWVYDPFWPFDRNLYSRADRMNFALGTSVATS